MKKIHLTLIFAASLLINNCKDKEEIIRHVDPELKEWGLYQKGTWWVYEEENTKVIDSFWVDSVGISFFKIKEFDKNKWEQLFTFIKSKNNSNKDIKLSLGGLSSSIVDLTTKNIINKEFGSDCIIVSIPFIKGERFSTGDAFKWTEMDTIYDTLKINNLTFKNVIRANDNGNPAFFGQKTLFYTARNIGIVRKEFPDVNQIWNLVRFNIIQ